MKEIDVLYVCLDSTNGYGTSARILIEAMDKIEGVNVDPLYMNKPNIQHEKKLKDHYDLMINHIAANNLIDDVQRNGYLKMCMARCKKVYQYILWESDRLPSKDDKFYMEPHIHGFVCPSKFTQSLVKKYAQYGKQSFYVPITTDVQYHPDMRKADPNVFTVLTVAQMSIRKAIDVSVVAFTTAFREHPQDVRYYIKIGGRLEQADPAGIVRANIQKAMVPNAKNIFLVEGQLADHEMEQLYLSSNCYLHLSRGEGFGMTPFTAMAYGLPSVYTDWSAHTEFLSKDPRSIAVPGRLDLVHNMDPRFGYEPEMLWFETGVVEAVQGLRSLYKQWKVGKLNYAQPDIIKEYREDANMKNIAKMLGIAAKDIKLRNVEEKGDVNLLEM